MRRVAGWIPGFCYLAGALCLLTGLWLGRAGVKSELVIVADVSDSLSAAAPVNTAAYERALRPDRLLRLAVAGTTRLLYDSSARAVSPATPVGGSDTHALHPEGTDLAQAIDTAAALPSSGLVRRRVLLLTDGRETTGDAAAAALRHAARMRVDVIPTGAVPVPDARVEWFSLPLQAHTGQTVVATAFLSSATAATVRVELRDPSGTLLQSRDLALSPAGVRAEFPLLLREPGLREYTLQTQLAGDKIPQNDRARSAVLVEGGNALLWFGRTPPPDNLLPEGAALRFLPPEQLTAAMLMPAGHSPAGNPVPMQPPALPAQAHAPDLVAGIILDNLSAQDLSGREALLTDYLHRGGGILILGGDNSLAPGGWAGTALAELLPVEVLPQERLQIMFALDVSGSMGEQNKLAQAQGALQAAVTGLAAADEAGLILFSHEARESLPLRPVREEDWAAALRNNGAGGGTSLFQGVEAALQALSQRPAQTGLRTARNRRHILLLTDGDTLEKGPERQQAADRIRTRLQTAGVGLWVIAVSEEADRTFLQELTSGIGATTIATGRLAELPEFLRQNLAAARGGYRRGPLPVRTANDWLAQQTTAFGPLRDRPGDALLLQARDGTALAAQGREGLGRVILLGGSPLTDWRAEAARAFLSSCLNELLSGQALSGRLHAYRNAATIRIHWQPEHLAGGPYSVLLQSAGSETAGTNGTGTPLRAQTGGSWTATLPAPPADTCLISILQTGAEQLMARGALSSENRSEYLQFGADGQALSALALAGGGNMAFSPEQLAGWDAVPLSGAGGGLPVLPALTALLFLALGLCVKGWLN